MNLDYIWKKLNITSFKDGKFYVVCMAVDKDSGKVLATAKNYLHPKHPKYKGHAEYLLINILIKMKVNLKDCYYIVSMDPCNGCLMNALLKDEYGISFDDIYIVHKKDYDCRNLKKIGRKHNLLTKTNDRHKSIYNKIKRALVINVLDSDSYKVEYK